MINGMSAALDRTKATNDRFAKEVLTNDEIERSRGTARLENKIAEMPKANGWQHPLDKEETLDLGIGDSTDYDSSFSVGQLTPSSGHITTPRLEEYK